jgi:hypothetical protein
MIRTENKKILGRTNRIVFLHSELSTVFDTTRTAQKTLRPITVLLLLWYFYMFTLLLPKNDPSFWLYQWWGVGNTDPQKGDLKSLLLVFENKEIVLQIMSINVNFMDVQKCRLYTYGFNHNKIWWVLNKSAYSYCKPLESNPEAPIKHKTKTLQGDKREPSARGYNWATLFLGDINTGTWPSRLGESQMRQ